MIKKIFIFVGGKGTRLGKLTRNTPKPLLLFNNKPFLDYILSNLLGLNPKKIYLLCGYKSELFFKNYHKTKKGKTEIICIKEKKPLGTAGSLYNVKKYISENSLICNGDTYIKYNFKKINNLYFKNDKLFMFCISNKNYKSNKKLNNLIIKKKNIFFSNKSSLMNAGIYIVNKKILKFINKKNFSLEDEIIPNLIENNKVQGKEIKAYSIDIGTHKNYNKFKKISKKFKTI